ncbi:MAG TPA: SDR family NAD(P)-dependent oxidoreductase [Candidatus Binatia bacterium]|nr:SDR family NAD(P)-dependent oxidoreductase [Candidatus Binatia bacterium]
MAKRLEGRAAVVTGAGRGIGRAIAELLAAEGASVVVNDVGAAVDGTGASRSVADEVVDAIRSRGGRAVASYESVADFRAAERIVATAVAEFGAIDVLVNNAGILRDRMLFNMSEEEWDAVVAVHLKGTFNCTRHAAVHMRGQRRGRIISMSSTSGVFGNSGQANYGAAKDGIAGLTRVVARDLGRYGITVNAVCPAAATRMTATVPQSARDARAARGVASPGGERSARLAHMGPENVAPWVVYLATDAARHVNGQTFLVMGGMIALLDHPAPVRTIQKDGRWTPEEIALLFPRTLGMELPNPAPRREAP